MKKIICVGSACKDMFFPTTEGVIIDTPEDILSKRKIGFELGAKYKIENRYEALGGCAANVAVGLSRLGIETDCYAHIGNDHVADWIMKELAKNKIGTEFVTKDEADASDMSAIIVDEHSAERVIFSNQKVNGKLVIDPKKISSTEWIFIGDLHGDWQDHLDLIGDVATKNKIKLAYNPREANIHDDVQKVIETIAGIELLFLNKDEAIEIVSQSGGLTVKELDTESVLFEALYRLGAAIVVLTDGVRGAWVYDGQEVFFAPGMKVAAVDSTGAGDAFCSGFLAAHLKEKTLLECLKWGIANSSSSVMFYGAIAGLLEEEKILRILSAIEAKITSKIN